MGYRYRNKKTGEEVTTTNRVNGKLWEPVEAPPAVPSVEDFEESDFEISEEEPVEAPPVEQPAPKSSRKDKK